MFSNNNNGYSLADLAAVTGNGGFGGGWGGDGAWILILFVLFALGGWGGFGGMGMGGGMWPMMMMNGGLGFEGGAFPWLLASNANNQNATNAGFDSLALGNTLSGIQSSITSGFGDTALGIAGINQNICQTGNGIQNALAQGFAGTTAAVTAAQNGIASQLYNNEIASLNRSFAEQTANTQGFNGVQSQLAQCCCDNRLATESLRTTVLSENCADRYEAANNTRDIIDSQTRSTQAILDKLCALELDGVKNQLAQAQRENVGLQNQLNMATMAASQAAQTATFQQGLNDEVDALYNRLNSCPVPTTPVYGRTPIFTCNNNNGCGCGGMYTGYVA